jgi:hypothetical protein
MQTDCVLALTDALNRSGAKAETSLCHPSSSYVNTIIVPRGSSIAVDPVELRGTGVEQVVYVDSHSDLKGRCLYNEEKLVAELDKLLLQPTAESSVLQCQQLGAAMIIP